MATRVTAPPTAHREQYSRRRIECLCGLVNSCLQSALTVHLRGARPFACGASLRFDCPSGASLRQRTSSSPSMHT